MFNNGVIQNKHDIICSIKMYDFKFLEFSNEIVCKFEKFEDDKFENDENERQNKKYVT